MLERLKNHESEELAVQISAYVDNEFDISVLMEEAEEKVAAMERVADLEDEIGRLNETMQELEVDAMAKQVHISRYVCTCRFIYSILIFLISPQKCTRCFYQPFDLGCVDLEFGMSLHSAKIPSPQVSRISQIKEPPRSKSTKPRYPRRLNTLYLLYPHAESPRH